MANGETAAEIYRPTAGLRPAPSLYMPWEVAAPLRPAVDFPLTLFMRSRCSAKNRLSYSSCHSALALTKVISLRRLRTSLRTPARRGILSIDVCCADSFCLLFLNRLVGSFARLVFVGILWLGL